MTEPKKRTLRVWDGETWVDMATKSVTVYQVKRDGCGPFALGLILGGALAALLFLLSNP